MYQHQLDALIAFASADAYKDELLKAKAHYFQKTGEIFEDDRSFEMRMASFLDFYVFDWPIPPHQRTPAQVFLDQRSQAPDAEKEILRGLTNTRHSLWEVRKLGKDQIRVRDLFDGKDVEVRERRQPAGLHKGDYIEARLIPVGEHLMFSQAFIYHPEDVRKNIAAEIKRLKKHEPAFDRREFIWTLGKMRLKLERYRNISPVDIYSFDRKTI